MKSLAPNGRTQRIRDYLRDHPASRSLAIARALGESTREVNHDLRRMESQHVVIGNHTLGYGKSEYTLNPTPPPPLRRRITRVAQPQPQFPPAQSVEEYIARGGHVEKLAANWCAPVVKRVGWNVQVPGRRHA